jgi:hypothetical protein
MDVSTTSTISTSSTLLTSDFPNTSVSTNFESVKFAINNLNKFFFDSHASKLDKINLTTNFTLFFHVFQITHVGRENILANFLNTKKKLDSNFEFLKNEISNFIKKYNENLKSSESPSPFDQTILLIMESALINPCFQTYSCPITIGTALLKKYPDAHQIAVVYLLDHLSLYEHPSNSGYFASDCEFAILLLTSQLKDLGSFSPEEYSSLIDIAFFLRKETFISYSKKVALNASCFKDEKSPRKITSLIKDHPFFPFDESSLLEKRKEIATNASSSIDDLVNWSIERKDFHLSLETLQIKWLFFTNRKKCCAKEIQKIIIAYFNNTKETFCINAFISNFSTELDHYCRIDLPTWNEFPYTKEVVVTILDLPMDLNHLLLQMPTLLKIKNPESQEILFNYLSNLSSNLDEIGKKPDIACSIWNHLKNCTALKTSSDFESIIVAFFNFASKHSDLTVLKQAFPPIEEFRNFLIPRKKFDEKATTFTFFLSKHFPSLKIQPSPIDFLKNCSQIKEEPTLFLSATPIPSIKNIQLSIDTLIKVFLSDADTKICLRQTVIFIQLFYSFQESLRNENGDHSFIDSVTSKTKYPEVCEFLPKIKIAIDTYKEKIRAETTNSIHSSTTLLFLESANLSHFIYNKSDFSLEKQLDILTRTYKDIHPVALTYLLSQLSIFSEEFKEVHATILMLAPNIFDNSKFSIEEHKYMRDLFIPIHHKALIEFLALALDDLRTLSNFRFKPKIYSILNGNGLLSISHEAFMEIHFQILSRATLLITDPSKFSLDSIKTGYSKMNFIYSLLHWDLPLCNEKTIQSDLSILLENFDFETLISSPKKLLLIPSFCLPKIKNKWIALSILNSKNQETKSVVNKNFIQNIIFSANDYKNPSELIEIIKRFFISDNFEKTWDQILNITIQLQNPFKEIFLHTFFLFISSNINNPSNSLINEKIKNLINKLNFWKMFSENNTHIFFNELTSIYCNLKKESSAKEKQISIWTLLIKSNNRFPSNHFKQLLLHRFLLTQIEGLLEVSNLQEERKILAEAMNLAESDEIMTLKALIDLATTKQKKLKTAHETLPFFLDRFETLKRDSEKIISNLASTKELESKLNTEKKNLSNSLETELEDTKKKIDEINKNLILEKESSKKLLRCLASKEIAFKNTLETIQQEAESKQTSLQECFTKELASLDANFFKEITFLETTLSTQREQAKKMITSLLYRNPVLCRINETPIKNPCILNSEGIKEFSGIGTALCEYSSLESWFLKKRPKSDLSFYIANDPFAILDKLLKDFSHQTLYKMDTTIEFKEGPFDRIQTCVKRLQSIDFKGPLKVTSIRSEKIKMLSNTAHFESILGALGTEFIPATAGFMLENLTTHTITIVESCCKLLLTHISPDSLFSSFTGQRVLVERSHHIVDLLHLICTKLGVSKTYKKTLYELKNVGANSVRPQDLPSSTAKPIFLEEILSGLRLSLQNDLTDTATATAASGQIQIVITWMLQLLSLTAELMELQNKKSISS